MFKTLFRSRSRERLGEPMYELAVAQAREPAFYARMGVSDEIDARFELYTLHVLLLVMRAREEGERGAEVAQDLFNAYVSALDHTLRELGVGDTIVGKKMRKLGEAMYGRMTAYEAPLQGEDEAGLAESLARNVLASANPSDGTALARYALDSRRRLAAQRFDDMTTKPDWGDLST